MTPREGKRPNERTRRCYDAFLDHGPCRTTVPMIEGSLYHHQAVVPLQQRLKYHGYCDDVRSAGCLMVLAGRIESSMGFV